jgi:hypothetical protein
MRKFTLSDTSSYFLVPVMNEIRLNLYELQLALSFAMSGLCWTSLRHISKCQQRLQTEESLGRGFSARNGLRVPMKGLGFTRPVSPCVSYCTCGVTGVNKQNGGTRNVVRGVQT